jgi:hypothetical protein
MTAAPSFYLPEELVYLLETVHCLPASEVANCALPHLERFPDPQQKAEIGAQLLTNISQGLSDAAPEAAKALEVMAKFPHYPRPRAAVAIAALKGLASKKVA